MKNWIKFILVILIFLFLSACYDNEEDTAIVRITNLSNFAATVWISNLGYDPITVEIDPATYRDVLIEDGEAGLNVDGGRAIIEYSHKYNSQHVPEIFQTYVFLSTSYTSEVQIDNAYGCLFVQNFSTNPEGDMAVMIDSGDIQIINPWSDLACFLNPGSQNYETYDVHYEGYTMFSGNIDVTLGHDDLTPLELHPDACGIWVENNSTYDVITAVFISPSYSSEWGGNILDAMLYPGDWEAWVCESEMSWDIKINDTLYEYTWYDINLDTDEIYVIDYDDTRSHLDSDAAASKLKNSAAHQVTNSNPRCEIVPRNILPLNR